MPKWINIKEWIDEHKKLAKWRKIAGVFGAFVVFITTYMLILPAITLESKPICGMEAHEHGADCYKESKVLVCQQEEREGHSHSDSCYTEKEVLTCNLEENEEHTHDSSCYTKEKELTCGKAEVEGHSHTDSCYKTEKELVCTKEEHKHTDSCYAKEDESTTDKKETAEQVGDLSADVEKESDWLATMKHVKLSGNWAEDVLAVADSQLGYKESAKNYIINEKGEKKGYTRYGAWYGNEYGDWCAMFASFCINYAGISRDYMPIDAGCQNWIENLNSRYKIYYAVNDHNNYQVATEGEEYSPAAGDLIFFNWDKEPDADHVGIVYEVKADEDGRVTSLKTIEGNAGDCVKYKTYEMGESKIMGFAKLPKNPNFDYGEDEEEVQEETQEEPFTELEVTTDGFVIKASFDEGTLPVGSTMKVEKMDPEAKDTKECEERILENFQEENEKAAIVKAIYFDINFLNADGEKIDPEGQIHVSIQPEQNIELEDEADKAEEKTGITGAIAGLFGSKDKSEGEIADVKEADHSNKEAGTAGADAAQAADPTAEQAQENIVWELIHVEDNGKIEKLTDDSATTIDIDDDNRFCGVEFQNDSFSPYAVMAVDMPSLAAAAPLAAGDTYTIMGDPRTKKSISVTVGKGYYLSDYYYNYQTSSHMVGLWSNETKYLAEMFMLIPRTSSSFTPNDREYQLGHSNYDVVYCADYNRQPVKNIEYITKVPLREAVVCSVRNDGTYNNTLSEAEKVKLNAIVTHAYPYVSASELLSKAGLSGTNCSESECLLACQLAIWRLTNSSIDTASNNINSKEGHAFYYGGLECTKFANFSTKYKNYIYNPIPDDRCNFTNMTDAQCKSYVNQIINYLNGVAAQATGYNVIPDAISASEAAITTISENGDGTYTVEAAFHLSRVLEDSETVTLELQDADDTSKTALSEQVTLPAGTAECVVTFTKVTKIPDKLKLVANGIKTGYEGYYYYDSNGPTSAAGSQHMVGVDKAEIPFSFECMIEFTSLAVKKDWVGGSESQRKPVKVQLYQNGKAYGEPVTLSDDTDPAWYYKWNKLPKKDKSGNEYQYTIKETTLVPGFKLASIDEVSNTEFKSEYWQKIPTGYELPDNLDFLFVKKGTDQALSIADANGNLAFATVNFIGGNSNATVWNLSKSSGKYYVKNKSNGKYLAVSNTTSVKATASNTSNAEAFTLGTNGYTFSYTRTTYVGWSSKTTTYYWTGSISNGGLTADSTEQNYDVYHRVTTDFSADKNFIIQNIAIDGEDTSVSVRKTWSGYHYEKQPIHVVLTRNGSEIDRQTLSDDNMWFYRWDGLEKTAADGSAYEYAVHEVEELEDYITSTNTYIDQGTIEIDADTFGDVTEETSHTSTLTAGAQHVAINNNRVVKFAVELKKASIEDKARFLPDAVFELYKQNPSSDSVIPGQTGVKGELIGTFTTDSKGKTTLPDIETGSIYYLVEKEAPTGYSKLSEAIQFKINDDGELVILSGQITDYEVDELTLTILDTPGISLPETGGPGTLPYTMTGIACLMLAGCLLYIKKNRKEAD